MGTEIFYWISWFACSGWPKKQLGSWGGSWWTSEGCRQIRVLTELCLADNFKAGLDSGTFATLLNSSSWSFVTLVWVSHLCLSVSLLSSCSALILLLNCRDVSRCLFRGKIRTISNRLILPRHLLAIMPSPTYLRYYNNGTPCSTRGAQKVVCDRSHLKLKGFCSCHFWNSHPVQPIRKLSLCLRYTSLFSRQWKLRFSSANHDYLQSGSSFLLSQIWMMTYPLNVDFRPWFFYTTRFLR